MSLEARLAALAQAIGADIKALQQAGGGAKAVTLQVQPARRHSATVTVVDAGVTAASSIECWLAASADWEIDDLDGFSVMAQPRAGAIDFTLRAAGDFGGSFTVHYVTRSLQ